jgi:TPP-dependent pyruvate/acetoin dehydrogenase alpha subunit
MDDNNSFSLLLADLMLRVTVLEKLLIDKGTLSKEEVIALSDEIATKVTENITKQANATKTVEDILNEASLTDQEKKDLSN